MRDATNMSNAPNSDKRDKGWQIATVTSIVDETDTVKTFGLEPSLWRPFRAGQHVDVRLTAPDGYQAQRSYSIASAPDTRGAFDITVELLEDGEVSPYFHDVVRPGDQVEYRGPIGGPFTWRRGESEALFLAAGGSGIVPIMSILRHRTQERTTLRVPAVLLYSSRTVADIIYRRELDRLDSEGARLRVIHTLTRQCPPDWEGHHRRIDADMFNDAVQSLAALYPDAPSSTRCYVCGPTDFVESVASFAVDAGFRPSDVRTERFGPTGT